MTTSKVVDDAIAFRVLYLLAQPVKNTDAYKLGIVDEDGTPLKKASELKTEEERESYSYLHRVVFRVKKMLGKIGSASLFPSLAMAVAMIKEDVVNVSTQEVLELVNKLSKEEIALLEDIASTNTGNVVGLRTEPISSKPIAVGKVFRRNRKSFKDYVVSRNQNRLNNK